MNEYYPTRFLPIGEDDGGNSYCLSLKKDDTYGSIYFVEHSAYHDEDGVHWVEGNIDKTGCDDMNGVYFIAKSFTEFIDMVKEDEDM